ncbi:MAG TPA: hypothetical protein DIC64_01825 [Alphaproteobacteria bacterium]|nr:hypothetical protein [Alphaproteobacteria bacterium]
MRIFLKLLASVKASYIPALIALIAVFSAAFFKADAIEQTSLINLFFFIFSAANLIFLFFSKNIKSTFFSLLILSLYICARRLLLVSPVPLATSGIYTWLMIIVALNLFLIFNISSKPNNSFYILLSFVAEAALLENFYISGLTDLPPSFLNLALFLWVGLFAYLLLSISAEPSIKSNAFFFASLLIFWALLNIENLSTLIFSLSGAMLIDLVSNISSVVYNYFYDPLTGLYSLNSFKRHDIKKFPPKYTVAFFYIDNYQKLLNVFKQRQTDKLTKMILKRVLSLEPSAYTYRLKPDQFCFVFLNNDVKQTYELIENMRRLVASTEFVLSNKKILKLTITPAVSEKRRSDSNAFAVLIRMYENFRQRYTFTQNITFCEEIEKSKKATRLSSRR